MAYESIKVDIIPGAENAEVLHFSQFDNKRPFFIELFNGADEFIPDQGMSLTLECRKRDGNIVIISNPVVTDNVVEFSTTEQLTACYGDNEAEIKIIDENDLVIGSANFIINVEKSPTCGGLVSESEIDNLTQQIEEITQEVIGEDYYNKTEVDNLLDDKADLSDLPDMSQYYTKQQTDDLLDDKADISDLPDMSHYYTKQQTDDLLDDKADISDLPDMSQYYTKQQTDNLIISMLPVGTASGNPCRFDTELAGPLQSLIAEIVASGGNGSPDSPIPIVGHSALNLDVNGDTFTVSFGQTVYGVVYDANAGKLVVTSVYANVADLDFTPSSPASHVFRTDSIGSLVNAPTTNDDTTTAISSHFKAMDFSSISGSDNGKFAIAGKNYAFIGRLVFIDHRYSTIEDFIAGNNTTQIVYPLATPIEIDVSALSVSAIVGTNNITSDGGGDVSVSYKDSIQHYIDSRI